MPWTFYSATGQQLKKSEIADNAVTTAKIAADAVTGAKIADDAIDSEHYTDGSIDTAHIADNQITLAKMAGGTDGQIITYDASGNPVAVGPGTDGQVLTSTGADSPPAFEAAPSPLTLVLSSTTTVGANGKSGVTLAAATAGPTVYVWDAWIATNDVQVAIPLDWNANETISGNVGTFLSRYSQTAGSTVSNFVIVNGSASSRAVVYQVFQIATP
jgi:hypothetical protein